MVGPQSVNIMELDIGDHVKVVGNDGSFEAIIVDACSEEGVTFRRSSDGGEFVIDFMDFQEYDLYPRGHTIKRLSDEKKALLKTSNCSKRAIARKEQTKTEKELKMEEHFFMLFDKLQNTSLGDQHAADMLVAEMKDLAHGNEELTEALGWALDQRTNYLEEAASI
jgi:hypothetical protein